MFRTAAAVVATAFAQPGLIFRNLLVRNRYRARRLPFRFDFYDPREACPQSYQPDPLRILMVVPSLGRGGAERMMIANAAELVKRGYQVRILALKKAQQQPDYSEDVARLELDYQCCEDNAGRFWPWWRRFRVRVLRKYARTMHRWHYDFAAEIAVQIEDFRPTVVHAWLNQPILIAGPVCYLMGVPKFIGGQHDILDGEKRAWVVPFAEAYRMIGALPNTTFTNVCSVGAREYERWLGLPAQSVKVLPNMFWRESVRFPEANEVADYRKNLGIPAGAQVVSTVTRMIEAKDPLLSVETAAEVAKIRPDVWFVFAGYGELAERVAKRVSDLGLSDRVVLPGAVSDVGLIYAITDVFMLTSLAEGAPLVLLEAQSAGKASVAADVGGIRELVLDGINARLISSRSAEEFAQAAVNILGDSDWRSRAETVGPVFVAERFSPDVVMNQTLILYGLRVRTEEPVVATRLQHDHGPSFEVT